MRTVYATLSIVFLTMGIIICFENILYAVPIMIGFTQMGTKSLFFPLLVITIIGFISGFFAGLALMSSGKKDDFEDDLDL